MSECHNSCPLRMIDLLRWDLAQRFLQFHLPKRYPSLPQLNQLELLHQSLHKLRTHTQHLFQNSRSTLFDLVYCSEMRFLSQFDFLGFHRNLTEEGSPKIAGLGHIQPQVSL